MDHSFRSTSLTPSDSSVDTILDPSHSCAPSHCSQSLSRTLAETTSHSTRIVKRRSSVAQQTRQAHRDAKRRFRLEQRLGPAGVAIRDQRKIKRRQLSESMASLLKEACMKRELKRAMGTKISPQSFQVIDTNEETNTDIGRPGECTLLMSTLRIKEAVGSDVFAGQITIQDPLGAMRQALSEHSKDSPRRKEPGRHSYHVGAAVSDKHDRSGIGVVFKTHRQDWASSWTAKGYQIKKQLDRNDAKLWAIWQAMELVLEKTYVDSGYEEPSDPCSLAVIYSDSQSALRRIGNFITGGGIIAQRIRNQAEELQELEVNVELHWCPGHRRVPGNSLADRLAKEATFHFLGSEQNQSVKPK
ncbi:MAG: hypothetical protein Q9172_003961 [Xanthocarpia lactea]